MSAPWNWVKDAFKWIGNAIKNIAKTILNIVKDVFKEIWNWIKNISGVVVDTIVDVGKVISDIVRLKIADAFKGLWDVVGDVVNVVTYTLQSIFKILDTLTFGLFSDVWSVISKLIAAIVVVVAAATGNVGLALAMITTSLLAATGAVRDPVLLLIVDVALILVGRIDTIALRLDRLVKELGDFVHVDIDYIRWVLKEGYASWTDILKGYLGDVVSKIGGILDMTTDEIWKLLTDIADSVSGTVGKVWDALKAGVEWMANNVKPAWGFVKNITDWTYDKIYKAVGFIVNTARTSWGWTVNNIGDVVLTIGNWIATKGKWLYNFVYNKVAKVWDAMLAKVTTVYEWAKDITKDLWQTVKNSAINAWSYINNAVKPFTTWVKETIWPKIQGISKTLIDAVNWINQKGKDVYLWYASNIKPYADKILDLIHKAAVISETVAAIRSGKITRALLSGIGILGGKIEDVSRNILKFYDGTLTSIMKGIGYSIGWVRKMITDMYKTASIIAKDVGQIGVNIGWDVLNEVGAFIGDVAKATLGKAYIKIGDVEKSVRDWIAYIREPVTRALSIIYQTHTEFHKYEHVYKAAYLRQLSTATRRPIPYVYLPKIAFEGVR